MLPYGYMDGAVLLLNGNVLCVREWGGRMADINQFECSDIFWDKNKVLPPMLRAFSLESPRVVRKLPV
jgi:hypothetical protein